MVELTFPVAVVKQWERAEVAEFDYNETTIKLEKCEILKEYCNIGLLMEQDVNDNGVTVMKIKVGRDTKADSYSLRLWDKEHNILFLATVVVEQKEQVASAPREKKKKVVEEKRVELPAEEPKKSGKTKCSSMERLEAMDAGKKCVIRDGEAVFEDIK